MKPIIDAHTHLFCGKDIPLKGYLLSRKYKKGLNWLCSLLIPRIAKCIRKETEQPKSKGKKLKCNPLMGLIGLFFGKEYLHWAKTLSKDVESITADLLDTFRNDGVHLYIPLLIDFEYWMINTPDNLIKEQIELYHDKIIIPHKGLIHPFVSFDPARELAFRKGLTNPEGDPDTDGSLNLVKDAIENKGFIGVKLYNAMGYKPFDNVSVEHLRTKIPMHKIKYTFSGEEYDDVLAELYDYCVENEVPITTHCGMYGSESYYNASFDYGAPQFWRAVLDQEKYKKLHLNLGHFGWYTKKGYAEDTWVKEICKMLQEYDNLYTDVSCQRVVVEKHTQKFKDDYRKMCTDFPIVKQRLIYGTDWHYLICVPDFVDYKQKFIQVLQYDNNFSDEEIDDFLGGNAMKFLGFYNGSKAVQRLEKFYDKNGIGAPQWFQSISLGDN
jgi:predicted TIM-barrel fold metal-dependent hydrolase